MIVHLPSHRDIVVDSKVALDAYLDAIAAPYQHLGVKYVPLGGVNEANCAAWFASRHVGCIGGSWLASKEMIAAGDWNGITVLARRVVEIRNAK